MIFANTYRGEYLRSVGHPSIHWQTVMQLIRAVPLFQLSRPRDLRGLAEQVGGVVDFVRQIDAKAG